MNTNRAMILERTSQPEQSRDYLTMLDGMAKKLGIRVTIRYIPDRDIVIAPAFQRYLDQIDDDCGQQSLEQLVIDILDDFNNEIVPRWVQIRAARGSGDGPHHHVLIEDRQPKWDNPALLAQLMKF
jgi:NADPH-dependent 7-cyano-7-deazaguanine reductase QueF